ncbi:hypothetical protein Tco_1016046 [Tanacetum coccineum]|uniref:Uncharacterized protein n=1 Tax=Tanacetum coccineum TaxID=301880 RepID=A0ABQ5FMI9_9ASTR
MANSPPPPQGGSPHGQTTYVRINPKTPPSPSLAPSHGQTTFGAESLTFTSQSTQTIPNTSEIHGMYGREDPRTPPSPEANGSQGHDIYGRDNPSVTTPPKPADPIRPVLNDYARIDVQ